MIHEITHLEDGTCIRWERFFRGEGCEFNHSILTNDSSARCSFPLSRKEGEKKRENVLIPFSYRRLAFPLEPLEPGFSASSPPLSMVVFKMAGNYG